ncbi:HAMP domain-containing histidine kinase [Mobilitalea sibirica]|uniref:histidine kinase n=1 Tax=Mobilitalea sibirica TaxID=1462919 RepID=A0A8J7H7Y0_9FIRM|nr:HAMP domain-containing sensor histidine kinase [Mobilitalea sibirica]MBH1939815.1 HAMP domain-containing histidine kinase [Mobilitalea sibirica]
MKTIKKKIALPFITIILLIPIITMILFHITLRVYVDRTAKEELQNTISGIEQLVKQQVLRGYTGKMFGKDHETTNNNLMTLRSALRVSNLTSNTEFLLLSEDEILFPTIYEDSFLTENLLKDAIKQLDHIEENELTKLTLNGDSYYVTYKALSGRLNSLKLFFISHNKSADVLMKTIYLSLLAILMLSATISIAIALGISRSISDPITKLSTHAKKIGNGEFLSLENNNSSREIHTLTKSMNEMSERLKNYDNAQKAFLQNASHELRTPLMSIQGYAEGIAGGVFSDTQKAANIICDESRRLNNLVDELLTLSRIENQTYNNKLVKENLCDMVKDCIQKVEGYALKEDKTITVSLSESPVYAYIDEVLLLQAVSNILSNCIKYARQDVRVTVFTQENQAIIRISDDGAGIAADDLPFIFDRFYKGKKGSFGLGLAIAKSAVEYMGGSINAFNDTNGAVFEIKLNN